MKGIKQICAIGKVHSEFEDSELVSIYTEEILYALTSSGEIFRAHVPMDTDEPVEWMPVRQVFNP